MGGTEPTSTAAHNKKKSSMKHFPQNFHTLFACQMIVFLVASFILKKSKRFVFVQKYFIVPKSHKNTQGCACEDSDSGVGSLKGVGQQNKRTNAHTQTLSLRHTQSENRMRAKRCKEIQVKFVKMGQPQYIHILNHKTIINSNHIFLTCKLLINIFNAHIHLLLTVSLHTAKHNRSNDEETKLKHLEPLVLNLSQHNKGR